MHGPPAVLYRVYQPELAKPSMIFVL